MNQRAQSLPWNAIDGGDVTRDYQRESIHDIRRGSGIDQELCWQDGCCCVFPRQALATPMPAKSDDDPNAPESNAESELDSSVAKRKAPPDETSDSSLTKVAKRAVGDEEITMSHQRYLKFCSHQPEKARQVERPLILFFFALHHPFPRSNTKCRNLRRCVIILKFRC